MSPSAHPLPQTGWWGWASPMLCPQPRYRAQAAGGGRSSSTAASSQTSSMAPSSASCSASPATGWVQGAAGGPRGFSLSLGVGRWFSAVPPPPRPPPPVVGLLCPGLGEAGSAFWGATLLGLGRAEPWELETQSDLQPYRCPPRWRRSRTCPCPSLARRTWPSSTRPSTRMCRPSQGPVGTATPPRAGLPLSWSISDGMPTCPGLAFLDLPGCQATGL